MLEPNNRRLLMEALQPPDGYHLDWAVGTTYTLDLMALLTAPVAFAFSDWQDRDGRPTGNPLALLKAVREYADRICLFCHAGRIHVPRSYQPLLASLEDSIIEAVAPNGGSFHPKVWFLRFVDKDNGEILYRVLCASRNMTFDRSWDTLLCLEGVLQERRNAYGRNHPLGQFVEALGEISVRPLSKSWQKRLAELASEIRRVDFEVPAPFDDLRFWPMGIGEPDHWPLPDRIDRLFVVSPFVDDGLIEDLCGWEAPTQLLSRSESLCRLSADTQAALDALWILDDTADPEPGETEESAEPEGDEPEADTDDQELPLVGLHAKLYVAEGGHYASVVTGSANATRAAFRRNVEFLIELQGRKSQCGIDCLLGQPSDSGRKGAASLSDLMQRWRTSDLDSEADSSLEEFEREVDVLAKSIAEASPTAECEQVAETTEFSLRLAIASPLRLSNLDDRIVTVRPASLTASHFTPVNLLGRKLAEFAPVSLLGLTSFFVFDVESQQLNVHRQFVLNIPLSNAPAQRHEAILKELLNDSARVMQFLLLLLLDSGARDLGKLGDMLQSDGESFDFLQSLFGATLFESLMRALDTDPNRLDQVEQVIRDLSQSAEGRALLPQELESIWEPIQAARESLATGVSQRRKAHRREDATKTHE